MMGYDCFLMEDEIIRKLRPILAKSIASEAKVAYILVQVRKLLEHNPHLKAQYDTLRFYCDWTVHTKLSGTGARYRLEFVDGLLENGIRDPSEIANHCEASGLFSLPKFHAELLQLLRDLGIWINLLELLTNWMKFLKYYSRIINQAPLVFAPPKRPPAGYVSPKYIDTITSQQRRLYQQSRNVLLSSNRRTCITYFAFIVQLRKINSTLSNGTNTAFTRITMRSMIPRTWQKNNNRTRAEIIPSSATLFTPTPR
jgi:hypothetical protein